MKYALILAAVVSVFITADLIRSSLMNDPQSVSAAMMRSSRSSTSSASSRVAMAKASVLPVLGKAPELQGLGTWFNSKPLTIAGLRGKVVLVHFWTFECINCIHTLPSVKGYWSKYKDTGKFIVLGVHTPELTFEKSTQNLTNAVKSDGLTYPIVQDNDYATWDAYKNLYWPAFYLIDAQGNIRYTHFGEGKYDEMDANIAALLKEISA